MATFFFSDIKMGLWLELGYGVATFLMIWAFVGWERDGRVTVPLILQKLGDSSYAIYLVHLPVVSVLCKLSAKLKIFVSIDSYLLYFFIVFTSVFSGIIFHITVEKNVNVAIRKWCF
ncbi:hypothetical protein [Robbsia sp. KACC 23696]|uniref:hypothetical protein n=1 Tax=Robbsia sp. KACC 23696 TaxID=3149231 RepID=UPI00325A6313